MSNLVVVAQPGTYFASLGAVSDAHARLQEIFTSNRTLGDYVGLATGLKVLTPDGSRISLAGGRWLASDGAVTEAGETRLVYLPAYQFNDDARERLSEPDPVLDPWLREMASRGVVICACGPAVWRLARAGLLDGRRAAVEAHRAGAFARAFPRVVVESHGMVTTGAVMTCAAEAQEPDFVIRAIDRALSPGAALWLAVRRGSVGEGEVSADPLVARAQLMIRERFTENLRVEDLAADLAVSHQTLIRRFRKALGAAPQAYIRRQRLQGAAAMLRETKRSIAEVAALVGYADTPSFRAAFQAFSGQTPTDYRKAAAR